MRQCVLRLGQGGTLTLEARSGSAVQALGRRTSSTQTLHQRESGSTYDRDDSADGVDQRARPQKIPRKATAPKAQIVKPTSGAEGRVDLTQGAWATFVPHLLAPPEALSAFEELRSSLDWEQRASTMRTGIMQPRLITYQADGPEFVYTYSRTKMIPRPWHAVVARIKNLAEDACGASFNSCLINYYRDGKDNMYWHSDNEPLYGKEPVIASISLGSTRDFFIRRIDNHMEKYIYKLNPGSLFVMEGTMQQHWQHALPRRSTSDARINLTFRRVVHLEQP